MGFYLAKLSLDQFRLGITIGFSFEGVQIDVDPYKYHVSADYYLLVELREKTLCDNYYIEYPNE